MNGWLPGLSAALAGIAAAFLSYRQSTRASAAAAAVETVRVDAAAYDRAREFDREVSDRIRRELVRAEREIAGLRETLAAERAQHSTERTEMLRRIDRLERVVFRLRRQLRKAGIDVDPDDDT